MTNQELNIRVAAAVMGWAQWADLSKDCPNEPGQTYFADWDSENGLAVYVGESGDVAYYFNPAEDISDAMWVFQKLRESGQWCCLDIHSDFHYIWYVRLTPFDDVKGYEHKYTIEGKSEILPKAICFAALEASEQKKGR